MNTGARRDVQAALVTSVLIGKCALVFHVSSRPGWQHTFDVRV